MLYEPAMRSVPKSGDKGLTGWMVLAMLVAFFGVVAGVNAYMIRAALSTMPGVEVKNSYVASQRYNGEVRAMRAQDALGWQADAVLRRAGDVARLELSMRDAAGKPVSGLEVSARLSHPVHQREDHAAEAVAAGAGRYVVTLDKVQAGAWTVMIEARQNGERVYLSRTRHVLAE